MKTEIDVRISDLLSKNELGIFKPQSKADNPGGNVEHLYP
jgi:hypothetical protein